MPKSKTFYVVIYRPPFPDRGVKHIIYREDEYGSEVTPPNITAVFRVQHVTTKQEALACCVEKLAGYNVSVSPIISKDKGFKPEFVSPLNFMPDPQGINPDLRPENKYPVVVPFYHSGENWYVINDDNGVPRNVKVSEVKEAK
jgi:hypothetical protein